MRSDAGLVFPGPGIDPDRVARLDEDRNGHDQATLRGGWLAGTGLRVAGEPRLRLDDLEVDGHGKLDADRLALIARPIEGHPILEVLRGLAELLAGQDELVVRVVVHEMEIVAVSVQVLDRTLLHRRARPLRSGLERPLDSLAALDVAQGDAHLCGAASHLDVVVIE